MNFWTLLLIFCSSLDTVPAYDVTIPPLISAEFPSLPNVAWFTSGFT